MRRRFANREELLELLAVREPGVDWPLVLDALTAEGVDVELLVKVMVNEEV